MELHKSPRHANTTHKLDFTELLGYYFHLHEELVQQFDEFRYNALDIVADPDVPFESVDEPTETIISCSPVLPWPAICDQSAKHLLSNPVRVYMRIATFPLPAEPLPL
jgi:hypothetical protein